MRYHEAFWVAIAAAAPVLVLSAVVQATEGAIAQIRARSADASYRMLQEKRQLTAREGSLARMAAWRARSTRGIVFLPVLSIFMLGTVLIFSLLSLADGRNVMTPMGAIVLTGLGGLSMLLGLVNQIAFSESTEEMAQRARNYLPGEINIADPLTEEGDAK